MSIYNNLNPWISPPVPDKQIPSDKLNLWAGCYIMSAPKRRGKTTFSTAATLQLMAAGLSARIMTLDESGASVNTPYTSGLSENASTYAWASLPAPPVPAVANISIPQRLVAEMMGVYYHNIDEASKQFKVLFIDSATAMFQLASGLIAAPAQAGGFVPGYGQCAARIDRIARANDAAVVLVVNSGLFKLEDMDAITVGAMNLAAPGACLIQERPTGRTDRSFSVNPDALQAARQKMHTSPSDSTPSESAIPGVLGA